MADKNSHGSEPQQAVRLQKFLADRGLGSRRQIESWIAAGRIKVDGEVAELGARVTASAVIELDGKRVSGGSQVAPRVIVLNKSAGTICSRRDPEGRPTVFDKLPKLSKGRWISAGRLDLQTTGLLIITNDGQLAHRLTHPSTGLDREYAVRIDGRLTDEEEQALRDGVVVDGEHLHFTDLRYYNGSGRNHWYHAVLMEGKNHEVRNLIQAVGRTVSRLKRVRFGPVVLPTGLPVGRHREMSDEDVLALYKLLKLEVSKAPRKRTAKRREASMLLPYPELRNL